MTTIVPVDGEGREIVPVRQESGMAILAILDRMTANGVTVDAIERVAALYEREQAAHARRAFHDALSAFKGSCPPILRTSVNPQFSRTNANGAKVASTFASLEDISRAIDGPLSKCGLSYRWGSIKIEGNKITQECIVSHRDGHSESSSVQQTIESKAGCSEQQKYGIAQSYAMRYSLIAALGLTTCDPDHDGNVDRDRGKGPRVDTITEEQVMSIETLIDDAKVPKGKFLAWAGVESVEDIPASMFKSCVAKLEEKRREAGGK